MNKKGYTGDITIPILIGIMFFLSIFLFCYILFVAVPRGNLCEKTCSSNDVDYGKLIDYEVESFSDICACKYEGGIRHFKIK